MSDSPCRSERMAMRLDAEATMLDFCTIGDLVETTLDGVTVKQYDYSRSTVCGFTHSLEGREEESGGGAEVARARVVLRLPISVVLSRTSRIRQETKAGEALPTPLYYRVVGEPVQGMLATVAQLAMIEENENG